MVKKKKGKKDRKKKKDEDDDEIEDLPKEIDEMSLDQGKKDKKQKKVWRQQISSICGFPLQQLHYLLL